MKIETADLDSGLPVCQVSKELREKLLKNLIGLFLNVILSGKSTGFKKTYFLNFKIWQPCSGPDVSSQCNYGEVNENTLRRANGANSEGQTNITSPARDLPALPRPDRLTLLAAVNHRTLSLCFGYSKFNVSRRRVPTRNFFEKFELWG